MLVLEVMHMVVKWCHFNVKVTSSCNIISQPIQEHVGSYFQLNNQELKGEQETESVVCVQVDRYTLL